MRSVKACTDENRSFIIAAMRGSLKCLLRRVTALFDCSPVSYVAIVRLPLLVVFNDLRSPLRLSLVLFKARDRDSQFPDVQSLSYSCMPTVCRLNRSRIFSITAIRAAVSRSRKCKARWVAPTYVNKTRAARIDRSYRKSFRVAFASQPILMMAARR